VGETVVTGREERTVVTGSKGGDSECRHNGFNGCGVSIRALLPLDKPRASG